MKMLLALLLGFFRLGVGDDAGAAGAAGGADAGGDAGGGAGADAGTDAGGASADAGDDQLDLDLDSGADAGDQDVGAAGADKGQPNAELESARREAREARERAERAEREAADIRAQNQRASSEEARRQADEDRILADPNADANEKWRIQANRRIRFAEQTAAQTAFTSQDSSDRANFSISCQGNKRLAYVKDQVETELARMRANGQNAPREAIAYFLLGKMAASAKPKGQAKAAPAKSGPRGGASSGAGRSDVQAKSGQSEREKRRARLENVNI